MLQLLTLRVFSLDFENLYLSLSINPCLCWMNNSKQINWGYSFSCHPDPASGSLYWSVLVCERCSLLVFAPPRPLVTKLFPPTAADCLFLFVATFSGNPLTLSCFQLDGNWQARLTLDLYWTMNPPPTRSENTNARCAHTHTSCLIHSVKMSQ